MPISEALHLSVLGPFIVERSGLPLKLPRKARALLGYLAAHRGQAVEREALADLLWPYQTSEQARHSLRNCLLVMKQVIGDVVISDFHSCRLPTHCDLDRFSDSVVSEAIEELRKVGALYRGEFLSGLGEVHSEVWDEWLTNERQNLSTQATQAFFRLAKMEDSSGNYAAAAGAVKRVIRLDPYCEPAHRLLMHVLSHAGRGPEALHHYVELAKLLKQELGVGPDLETQKLRQRILEQLSQVGASDQQPTTEKRPPIELQDMAKQLQSIANSVSRLKHLIDVIITEVEDLVGSA